MPPSLHIKANYWSNDYSVPSAISGDEMGTLCEMGMA